MLHVQETAPFFPHLIHAVEDKERQVFNQVNPNLAPALRKSKPARVSSETSTCQFGDQHVSVRKSTRVSSERVTAWRRLLCISRDVISRDVSEADHGSHIASAKSRRLRIRTQKSAAASTRLTERQRPAAGDDGRSLGRRRPPGRGRACTVHCTVWCDIGRSGAVQYTHSIPNGACVICQSQRLTTGQALAVQHRRQWDFASRDILQRAQGNPTPKSKANGFRSLFFKSAQIHI